MTEEERQNILSGLPWAQLLPDTIRAVVLDSLVEESIPFGAVILREGAPTESFYVVAQGRVRLLKTGEDGQEVALDLLHPGDTFGELALLEGGPSAETLRAASRVLILRLDRSLFLSLLSHHPELRTHVELQARHLSLRHFFRLFSAFKTLKPEALKRLLSDLETLELPAGAPVVCEGDPPGPMYFIREGRLHTFLEVDGTRQELAYLRRGEFFGELSCLRNQPRSAHVACVTDCRLLVLRPETVRRLSQDDPDFQAALEARIRQYDYKTEARVPLDFTDEALPSASAQGHPTVGLEADAVESETSQAAPDPGGNPPLEGLSIRALGALGKKRSRFPVVRQIDEMDCGAACLAMICRHFGRPVSLTHIRHLMNPTREGLSLQGLCQGARALGLAARAIKADPALLERMPVPTVLHWGGNHWVVLQHATADRLWLVDPAVGHRIVRRAEADEQWTGYAALFDYTDAFEETPLEQPGMGWLLGFLKPWLPYVAHAAGLTGLISLLEMAFPVFTQIIVDTVLVEQDLGLLNVVLMAMLGTIVLSVAAVVVQRYLLSFVAVRVDATSLDFLTRRLLELPLSYFLNRKTGDIQRRLSGMQAVRQFLVSNGVSSLVAIGRLLAALALMVIYSPLLAAVFLVTAPLYGGLMRFSTSRLRPLFNSLEEALSHHASRQIDAIRGIETVKTLGVEPRLRELLLEDFHGLARQRFDTDFTMMCYDGAVRGVNTLTTALFLFVGARQVIAGELTVGALVAFSALVGLANGSLVTLLNTWDRMQLAQILLNRLADIFESEPEQGHDRSALLPVPSLEGHIQLHQVSFSFEGKEGARVLDQISLVIEPGQRVAIVGRSGSGKSTLVKLLVGLLEPTEGRISYDRIDLKTLNYRQLRRQVGFVLQDTYVFDETIARNISLADDSLDMDRVLQASRIANAHDFIQSLPLGYQSRIGESGLNLSGGQRQRIAIARALYAAPPVVIFDEATSALDTESERLVQQNMAQVLQDRTAIIIAHRMSTIRDADRILVLEKGRIVEDGGHRQLMDRGGIYYYLCSQQLDL